MKVRKLFFLLVLFLVQVSISHSGSMFQDALRRVEADLRKIGKIKNQNAADLATILTEGGYVTCKAHNNKFLSLSNDGTANFSAAQPKEWEMLSLIPLTNNNVALFGVHGNFASARLDQDGNPMKQAAKLLSWEIFQLVKNADGSFSLKCENGKFLSVEPDGATHFRADAINDWEKLQISPVVPESINNLSNGLIVGLMNQAGSSFFSVYQDENYEVKADSKEARIWERFRLINNDGKNFSFQIDNGNYLTVETNTKQAVVSGNADKCGPMESFQIFCGKSDGKIYLKAANGKFVRIVSGRVCADSDEAAELNIKILPESVTSDLPEIKSKFGLKCSFISEFTTEWNSKGLGTSSDVFICRPKVPKGWFFVGDVISIGREQPGYSAIIIQDTGSEDDLKAPVDYEEIWNDKAAKKNCQHVSFWRPIPPKGYVAMGFVATRDHKKPAILPSFKNFRCIAEKHVVAGRASRPVWNDRDSGAEKPISLMVVGRDYGDISSLPAGTFLASFYNNSSVGGKGGGAVTELSHSSDWYLAGFEGRCGGAIDAIAPVFRSFSDPSRTMNGEQKGGNGGGKFSEIAEKDYAVSGISGKYSDVINRLKIQYMKIDGRMLDLVKRSESRELGEGGNTDFSLGQQGCLFQGVEIRSGALIDAINLIPMPIVKAWVIPAQTKEEMSQEIIDGITNLYIEKNQAEIDKDARNNFLKEHPELNEPEKDTTQNEPEKDESEAMPDLQVKSLDLAPESLSRTSDSSSNTDQGKSSNDLKKDFDVSDDLEKMVESISDFLGLKNPKFVKNGNFLTLSAEIELKLSEKIPLKFLLAVDFPIGNVKNEGIIVRADIPGEWKNVLGFSGLTLEQMGFGGNIALADKKDKNAKGKFNTTLFLKGALDIGLSGPVKMVGAYDPAAPGLAGFIGELEEVSWDELMKIANFFYSIAINKPKTSLPAPDFPMDLIKIQKANFMVAKKTVANLDLEMGTRLRGDLIVDKNNLGIIEFLFGADGKTTAIGRFDPQNIGGLKISTPFGVNNPRGGPICTIIRSKEKNKFSIKGMVSVGSSNLAFDQDIGSSSIMTLSGSLGGVLATTLRGEWKTSSKNLFPEKG
ncbi:MAG: Vps62-related protein, partial [Candidatus Rifleibacteriota bacterium]